MYYFIYFFFLFSSLFLSSLIKLFDNLLPSMSEFQQQL